LAKEARFELSLTVDRKDQGLRCVAAAFALFGAGLMTPVLAGGADGGGRSCDLMVHGMGSGDFESKKPLSIWPLKLVFRTRRFVDDTQSQMSIQMLWVVVTITRG
jgi:hypothetical protein